MLPPSLATSDLTAPALLVSLHDVSPLTLPLCKQAVAQLTSAGIPLEALTLLVIPFHESVQRISEHRETLDFLNQMQDAGATLVMHGLTHRMRRPAINPLAWPMAYGFARGQGEFCGVDGLELVNSLDRARSLLSDAGFHSAVQRFVPPAWLVSEPALPQIEALNFQFYELFGGIYHDGKVRARRLIGWGSLSAFESAVTSLVADATSLLPVRDTRLAVHPADMAQDLSAASLNRVLSRLRERVRLLNYERYLSVS